MNTAGALAKVDFDNLVDQIIEAMDQEITRLTFRDRINNDVIDGLRDRIESLENKLNIYRLLTINQADEIQSFEARLINIRDEASKAVGLPS